MNFFKVALATLWLMSVPAYGMWNPFSKSPTASPSSSPKVAKASDAKQSELSETSFTPVQGDASVQPIQAAQVPAAGSEKGSEAAPAAEKPAESLLNTQNAAAGAAGSGAVGIGLSKRQKIAAFFGLLGQFFTPKINAGLIATAGAGTFALTEHPNVQQFLEKLNISSLDTEILVPLLSILLTFGAAGYETPKTVAKFIALATAFAKFYASNPVQLGIHKIPVIGNLVSDQDVARINNGQVTVDEQSAKAWQTVGAISLFAALRSLNLPKFGKNKEKVA